MIGWFLRPDDYEQVGDPVKINDEVFMKYRVPIQGGREFWAINNNEVWYPDEELFDILDKLQEQLNG